MPWNTPFSYLQCGNIREHGLGDWDANVQRVAASRAHARPSEASRAHTDVRRGGGSEGQRRRLDAVRPWARGDHLVRREFAVATPARRGAEAPRRARLHLRERLLARRRVEGVRARPRRVQPRVRLLVLGGEVHLSLLRAAARAEAGARRGGAVGGDLRADRLLEGVCARPRRAGGALDVVVLEAAGGAEDPRGLVARLGGKLLADRARVRVYGGAGGGVAVLVFVVPFAHVDFAHHLPRGGAEAEVGLRGALRGGLRADARARVVRAGPRRRLRALLAHETVSSAKGPLRRGLLPRVDLLADGVAQLVDGGARRDARAGELRVLRRRVHTRLVIARGRAEAVLRRRLPLG
mmetsp:Transcript_11432/g.27399  ORF Transcript_11432/g.27399 Transcript_11432/m.27399 type:complete len:351 (+) Transcript_11432:182-1234(+)